MALVRVFREPDLRLQHLSEAPGSETAKRWHGMTSCGLEGDLVWIHVEQVDNGMACPECVRVEGGIQPPLDGDDAGPV